MYIPLIAITTLILTEKSSAFVTTGSTTSFLDTTTASQYHQNVRTNGVVLHMVEEKKKLTAADILARARKSVNRSSGKNVVEEEEEEEEPDFLFDDDLLDDMKQCLVTLEKRVKEGPGCLTVEEIQGMADASARILKDMNVNTVIEQKQPSPPAASLAPPPPPAVSIAPPSPQEVSSTGVVADNFDQDTNVVTPYSGAPATIDPTTSSSAPEAADGQVFTETSDEEGKPYDGKGGMGLAAGTRNTYLIPGMDEMSPEEYRAALQQSVSDRQRQRRGNRDGLIGNRSALQYLDQLGYGGASDNWKVGDSADEGDQSFQSIEQEVPPAAPTPPPPTFAPFVSSAGVVADNFNQDTNVVTPSSGAPATFDPDTFSAPNAADGQVFTETSDEEGKPYDGKGGMGLAAGTRNTYLIPGMDEMSPEEYRAALQQSVSDRQRQRRGNRDGLIGNRSALQYLDQLGYGGASDNWKVGESAEE